MSYILEALRKSEQERQRSNPPSIHANHAIGSDASLHASPVWIKWLGIVVLVGGAIAGVILWPKAHLLIQPKTAVHTLEHADTQQQRAISRPAQPSNQSPAVHAPAEPSDQARSGNLVSHPGKITLSIGDEQQQAKAVEQVHVSPTIIKPRQNSPAEAANQDIQGIPQLPESTQQALPAINIAGHIYAEAPASRMVMINGRITHEGDAIASGLTLEAITPDGIILMFRGTRFHMSVFQHWPPGG